MGILLNAFLRIIPPFLSGISIHYATPALRHLVSCGGLGKGDIPSSAQRTADQPANRPNVVQITGRQTDPTWFRLLTGNWPADWPVDKPADPPSLRRLPSQVSNPASSWNNNASKKMPHHFSPATNRKRGDFFSDFHRRFFLKKNQILSSSFSSFETTATTATIASTIAKEGNDATVLRSSALCAAWSPFLCALWDKNKPLQISQNGQNAIANHSSLIHGRRSYSKEHCLVLGTESKPRGIVHHSLIFIGAQTKKPLKSQFLGRLLSVEKVALWTREMKVWFNRKLNQSPFCCFGFEKEKEKWKTRKRIWIGVWPWPWYLVVKEQCPSFVPLPSILVAVE